MSNKRIRAVAFDVDGTLYPNGPMYVRSIPIFLANIRFLSHFRAVRRFLRDNPADGNFHRVQAELLAKRLRTSPDRAAKRIERIVHSRWESLLDTIPPYDGVTSLVAELRDRGVPLGVLSDFPVETKLARLGLEGYWNSAFSTEDLGFLKPNKQPFHRLVEELGVDAAELLYVGNSYEYDILGAKGAGLLAAHITRRAPAGSIADLSFSRFSELREWLWEKLE